MAGPRVSQSSGYCRWKQWWRSPNTRCCKKILLLLVWYVLFSFSWSTLEVDEADNNVTTFSLLISYLLAPFIGWLADVKFGRCNTLNFPTFIAFLASIFLYFALITAGVSTLNDILLYIATALAFFGESCFTTAMLPFLTDQIIGATSDELAQLYAGVFGQESLAMLCLML